MSFRAAFLATLSLALLAVGASAAGAEPSAPPAAGDLVVNGEFESQAAGWTLCGGASVVDTAKAGKLAAAHGQYGARLGNPTRGCPDGNGVLDIPIEQALSQKITVPANASALTLSFWYYVDGGRHQSLEVGLAPGTNSSSSDGKAVFADVNMYDNPGWQQYRQVLRPEEVRRLKGREVYLVFRLLFPMPRAQAQTFRIDDVSVVPAAVTTKATAKVPAALKGDGTRPIAFIRSRTGTGNGALYRMDTDGSKAEKLYAGLDGAVNVPEWSPNGKQIAVADHVYEDGAVTCAITLVDRATKTARRAGEIATDAGDALDCDAMTWSPNGKSVAVGVFDSGDTRVEQVQLAGGRASVVAQNAADPNWGAKNRLLFEVTNPFDYERGWGIADAAMTSPKPKANPLIPGTFYESDIDPAWSPNGKQFVTVRATSATHKEGRNLRHNQALMLFDRADVRNGRMIFLADHGTISDPAWSPKGDYLLYTLQTSRGSNIWWLHVASGATGPLTNDNVSYAADWAGK